jgi:glycosyltransferase involved in cell wall biosynthesis
MTRPLNILQIIVQNQLRSGGAIQMYRLSRGLVKRGHRVSAIFSGEGRAEEDFAVFENSGIDLHFFRMNRLKLSGRSLETILALREHIRDRGYDLIHAHKGNAVDLVMCATLGMDIPIIANNGMSAPMGFLQGLKYRSPRVGKIIAVSHAVKWVMIRTGHVDPDKIAVVYGEVDTEAFRPGAPSSLREELSLGDGRRIIGYVGSALPRKGLGYLLQSFERIAGKHPDVALALAGVRPEDLAGEARYASLRERIHPLGFRTDVPNCMGAFDVFVFPGIHDEGLTGTVREAAAMGLPVVTTDVGGNSEIISDRLNGLVVPARDSEKLADAIEYLLENREQAHRFGHRAREFVEEFMSPEIRVRAVENIYYKALRSARRDGCP